MIIRAKHLRPDYCVKGCRAFAKQHNLDFDNFVKNGIDETVLLKTGNAMAIYLVHRAKARENK